MTTRPSSFNVSASLTRPVLVTARARFLLLVVLGVLLAPLTAQAQPEVIEYYALDHLGSVRVVFDANGNVVARADYAPFGDTTGIVGTLPPVQFTGQARDGEAGFDYFGARFYQPRHGRFSTVDPVYAGLFDPQSWNRYTYVRNSPLALVDPDGRNAQAFFGPDNPFFCSAENSLNMCGGADGFWSEWSGGGGGFSFGDGHAWALSVGWTPGMPEDMAGALMDFVQRSETALIAASIAASVTTSQAYRPGVGEINLDLARKLQATALSEIGDGTVDQLAAVISTIVNRAWLGGGPLALYLNSNDYQGIMNVPWQDFYYQRRSNWQVGVALHIVLYDGPTTTATGMTVNSATPPAGQWQPTGQITGARNTLYLWTNAPGTSVPARWRGARWVG